MECKVNEMSGFMTVGSNWNISRMECKEEDREDIKEMMEDLEYIQNGM